ncbi:MAG: 16S rRNA (cytosine(1402)-N(4))-methyltransferase RsmH [Pseudomonadota bacterium]|nr:16S rRNA (cytosine(1402)-N(4))-methyltransferase RsmH [Pseudomonadota bacterium]
MTDVAHTPVLLEESLEALAIKPDGIYLDGTFGRGGHARGVLSRLGPEGRLVALDRDPEAIAMGEDLARREPRFSIEHAAFSLVEDVARRHGIFGAANGLLLDLGVSSPQLDAAERGFSFMADGPLDMRMNRDAGESADRWLARASEAEIARVLRDYGEERYAGRIARAIVRARRERPVLTTRHLAEIVAGASPTREPGKHPATRTFQAFRIHINRELEELRTCLACVCGLLAAGGRLVVISFHSLEDRIVKRFIREKARGERFPLGVPVRAQENRGQLRAVGKPVRPSPAEVAANPRARSAVMRVAERLS